VIVVNVLDVVVMLLLLFYCCCCCCCCCFHIRSVDNKNIQKVLFFTIKSTRSTENVIKKTDYTSTQYHIPISYKHKETYYITHLNPNITIKTTLCQNKIVNCK